MIEVKILPEYIEWEKKWKREIKFWFSKTGEEVQLNLIAQGYEKNLKNLLMPLFPSPSYIREKIDYLEREVNNLSLKNNTKDL